MKKIILLILIILTVSSCVIHRETINIYQKNPCDIFNNGMIMPFSEIPNLTIDTLKTEIKISNQ